MNNGTKKILTQHLLTQVLTIKFKIMKTYIFITALLPIIVRKK